MTSLVQGAAPPTPNASNASFGRPWSSAEDAALKAAVDRYQTSWKVMVQDPSVSQILQGRTPSALRNRWQVLTNGASIRESRRELKEARSAAEQAPPSFPPTASTSSSVPDPAQLAQWNYQYMLAQQAQRRKQQQRRKRTRDSDEEESSSSEEEADESDLAEDTDSEGEGGSKKKRKLPTDGSKNRSSEDKEGFLFYYQNRDSLFDVCETGQVPTKTLKELFETTFGFGEAKTLSLLRELGVTPDPYERKEKISKALFDHFSQGNNRQITLYPIQTASAAVARPRSRPRPSRPARAPGVLASGAGALAGPMPTTPAAAYAAAASAAIAPAAIAALMNTPGRPNYFPSHYSLSRPSPGPVATTLELTDHDDEPPKPLAPSSNAFGGDVRNAMVRARNNYKCGRCGQPKRGHKCMM